MQCTYLQYVRMCYMHIHRITTVATWYVLKCYFICTCRCILDQKDLVEIEWDFTAGKYVYLHTCACISLLYSSNVLHWLPLVLLLLLHFLTPGHYEVIISGSKFIICDRQRVQFGICHPFV